MFVFFIHRQTVINDTNDHLLYFEKWLNEYVKKGLFFRYKHERDNKQTYLFLSHPLSLPYCIYCRGFFQDKQSPSQSSL